MGPYCLFISDLHLCESRPRITETFIDFLHLQAREAQALYILGDLFEYWPGDDAIGAGMYSEVLDALKRSTDAGLAINLMHGNRDFLLGETFAKATGVVLLSDPTVFSFEGKTVLLSHGDALCTDDVAYQQFRHEVRSEAWQRHFLGQPLQSRISTIEQLRLKSEKEKSSKSMQIMDVNSQAVNDFLAKFRYPQLFIHGHTHRPKMHIHHISGHQCERWVLGDWYEQGSYLRLDNQGCHTQVLA